MKQKENSGKRQLAILLDLLEGKRLSKKALEEEYGVSPRTIQNDMAQIREALEEKITCSYNLWTQDQEDLDKMLDKYQVQLEKLGGGQYFLRENITQLGTFGHYLTLDEGNVILKILLESRALSRDEMFRLLDKIIQFGDGSDYLQQSILNEKFYYQGVPTQPIMETMSLIHHAIEHRLEISFDYRKNFVTHHFRKIPEQLYFQDLYFYMVSEHHSSQDDRELEKLNKFRVNNMENIQIHEKGRGLDTHNRFQPGVLRNHSGMWGYFGKPITLSIEFYYDPVYVLDRFPGAKIISQHFDENRQQWVSRIDIPTNDGYGVKMWLLMQADQLKILSPKSVKEYVIQSARNMLDYYSDDSMK